MWGQNTDIRFITAYVAALNARDLPRIEQMLAPDCRFIDSDGGWLRGREDCLEAIRRFFGMVEQFEFRIARMTKRPPDVLLAGDVVSSEPHLARDTLWRARAGAGQLLSWQSFSDQQPPGLARVLMGERARTVQDP